MKVKTTAENRKDVVKAMEEILNVKAKYQGPPSFGYKVGEYTVDRDGNGFAVPTLKKESRHVKG